MDKIQYVLFLFVFLSGCATTTKIQYKSSIESIGNRNGSLCGKKDAIDNVPYRPSEAYYKHFITCKEYLTLHCETYKNSFILGYKYAYQLHNGIQKYRNSLKEQKD